VELVAGMEDPLSPQDGWKRERDVFNLYAAFQNIPHIDIGPSADTDTLPSDFVPKPASDASLAAFAQLAAFRLNAQRAVISLLDGQLSSMYALHVRHRLISYTHLRSIPVRDSDVRTACETSTDFVYHRLGTSSLKQQKRRL
jgi:hypothetical protein